MTPLLDFRKPNVTILERSTSWSGKYFIFLGSHYHHGSICWVFGGQSRVTGITTMRHYNSKETTALADNPEALKAYATNQWEEYKEKMKAAPDHEEESNELFRDIEPYLN